MTQLTPHFTRAEATQTSKPFENSPSQEQLERIIWTAHQMEIVRAVLLRNPINVSSWFRSEEINTAVGGASNSEHLLGAAVDFTCPKFGTPYEICQSLIASGHIVNYNQLIYEHSWVHISFPLDGVRGKLEVLTLKSGGRYSKGLVK